MPKVSVIYNLEIQSDGYPEENIAFVMQDEVTGLILHPRGDNDRVALMTTLGGGDGNWFISVDCKNTHWLDNKIELLQYVKEWLETNCKKNEHGEYLLN